MSRSAERGSRYTTVAIALHWLIALAILAMLAIGLTMTHVKLAPVDKFKLYQLHKSIGLTILALALLRLGWRLVHRPPALPAAMPAWERGAAEGTHVLLYGFMIGLPLLGWAMVSASPFNLPTVLYGVLPWPHLPIPDKAVAARLRGLCAAWVRGAARRGRAAPCPGQGRRHPAAHAPRVAAPQGRPGYKDFTMIRNTFVAATLAACLAATGASAATWTVDPAKSRLGFSGTQTEQPFSGQFKTFAATIDFDPAKPEAGHALVTIDMGSATTGDPQKDEALPGADWFDTKAFPQAKFEATGFKAKGGDAYEADGTLTIRGISKPVALPFTLTTSGDTAHAVGKVQLVRAAFGVGQGAWSTPEYVAFEVNVDIDLTATKAP
jgi:polyisoprenoid-binding protein YceI/cytochrome b561